MMNLLTQLDIGRALVAVAIALAIFGVVQNDQNPAEAGSFNVPVDVGTIPSGLVPLGDEASPSVLVRVNAPRENWVSMRSSTFRAEVDLTGATAGAHEYPVNVTASDPRIRIVDVSPPRITVRLDENLDQPVPVRIVRTGNVPFGYQAGDPQVDPSTVTVSGPSSIVRRVESAVVELRLDGVTVEINGRYTPTPVDAQGQAVTANGRPLRLTPATVQVRVPITQQLSYKTVGVQATIVGTVQSGYVIEGVATDPSAVTVVGPPANLANVNVVNTEPVDATGATSTISRQVGLALPDGVAAAGSESVRVTVQVAPLVLTQAFTTVPVVEDLDTGLQVTSQLPAVQVTVQGPASSLQSLRSSDLRATVSLAGLGPGSQRVTVEVTAPAGLTVQSVNPRVITVTIADVESALPPPTLLPTEAPTPTELPATPTSTVVRVIPPTSTATSTPARTGTPTATVAPTLTVGTPVSPRPTP